jgi:hypothetical protein
MLELYHGGPGANSLKALLPLKEKGIEAQQKAEAAARESGRG